MTNLQVAASKAVTRLRQSGGIVLVSPHLHQQAILNSRKRFIVAVCGRRFGKTEMAKRMIIERAMQGQQCWWIAPTYPMASEVWRSLINVTRPLRPLVNLSERYIMFDNGGTLSVKSGHNEDSLRGSGLDFVVLDEAAYFSANLWAAVVRPMLADREGSALFISTPRGRNWFYSLYVEALSDPQWQTFNFPSAPPTISEAELASIQRTTPERVWREEYRAEFLEDSGSVFRNVDLAATAELLTEPVPGREYLIGVDLAKLNDYTVFTVMDMDSKAAVALDRFQQVDYTVQLRRLEALSQRFNPTSIIVERNVGEMFIEVAQRMNLPVRPFMTTNASKQTIIEELALAFEQGAIQIPNDDVLKNELKAFAMERLPGGLLRFNAPAGFHDDMVISLALAYYGCKVHSTGDPLVFDDFPVW